MSWSSVNSVPVYTGTPVVNDMRFDFFGNRLAVCYTDHYIRIFERNFNEETKTTDYEETACWKAHNASVWRVSWAHPEFGQILASCSLDRQVIIWEEVFHDQDNSSNSNHWIKRVTFVDSRANVSDVRFAPKHVGLYLALTSFDGSFRVYEAANAMNLSVWSIQAEVPIETSECSDSNSGLNWLPALCCLSWSKAKHGSPIIAIGVDRSVQYGQTAQRKIAKSNLRLSHLQCWQTNSNDLRKWKRIDNLNVLERIRDVSFAPSHGRSFHLLAAALEHEIQIYTITLFGSTSRHSHELNVRKIISIHNEHHADVNIERIRWNITGSLIVSIDAKGRIVASIAESLDNWKLIEIVEQSETEDKADNLNRLLSHDQ